MAGEVQTMVGDKILHGDRVWVWNLLRQRERGLERERWEREEGEKERQRPYLSREGQIGGG